MGTAWTLLVYHRSSHPSLFAELGLACETVGLGMRLVLKDIELRMKPFTHTINSCRQNMLFHSTLKKLLSQLQLIVTLGPAMSGYGIIFTDTLKSLSF